MPCEIELDGAFQSSMVNEPFDETVFTMSIANANGKAFFVATNMEGERVAISIPRILKIREVDA